MEQLLSAFGIEWKLLLAQAVNFGIVMVGLWYFLYRPVMTTLEKRRALIAQGVSDAEAANEKLKNADTEAAERIKGADTEAEHIVSAAREAANVEKTRVIREAEGQAVSMTRDAETRAHEIAAKVKRESENEIARTAILAAEKILKSKYD